MKILLVTQYFWPENFRINQMCLDLKNRGHEITVFTGLPNYPSGKIFDGYGSFKRLRENYEGIEIIRFAHFPRGNCGFIGMSANFVSFALFGSLSAPFLLKNKKFDIIFVYEPSPITVGFPAVVMRSVRKIPLVFWVQDLWPESLTSAGGIRSPLILNAVDKMVRFLYKRYDKILVTSRGFIPSLVSHGADIGKVEYYPQSAEPCFMPVTPQAEEKKLLPEGFIILFAGNIGVSQDFPTILKAAQLTKDKEDLHWVIIGSGRMDEYVKNEVTAQGLNKTFHMLGRHAAEKMPGFFAHADAMLVTLKNDPIYHVTIPAKLQAYMASGRPVLAAIDGEGAQIIKEAKCGIAVPSESPEKLAAAAIELYNMPKETREEMGQNALSYSNEHFNTQRLMDRLEEILLTVKASLD